MIYDVIIVGAGPAGIFSALELVERNHLSILILDRGPDIDKRKCPSSRGLECHHCEPCSVLSGWGGAGAYSDGKLTLSTEVGGWLNQYISEKELKALVAYVDSVYLKYGASEQVYGGDNEKVNEIDKRLGEVERKIGEIEVDLGSSSEAISDLKESTVQKTEFDEFVNRLTESLRELLPPNLAEPEEVRKEEQ